MHHPKVPLFLTPPLTIISSLVRVLLLIIVIFQVIEVEMKVYLIQRFWSSIYCVNFLNNRINNYFRNQLLGGLMGALQGFGSGLILL